MYVFGQVFWAPKAGNSKVEYEDAFYPTSECIELKTDTCRFAIGDGATETSFARQWSQLLVKAAATGRLIPEDPEPTLIGLRARWRKYVSRKDLSWYAEEKARMGAYSSLLNITINETYNDGGPGEWVAFAVGDSCLFHVRNDELMCSFPIKSSTELGSRPVLLPSVSSSIVPFAVMRVPWKYEDHFFLMTDALAHWFLRLVEAGQKPWNDLHMLTTDEGSWNFQAWLEELRVRRMIKNDDVTLTRISVAYGA